MSTRVCANVHTRLSGNAPRDFELIGKRRTRNAPSEIVDRAYLHYREGRLERHLSTSDAVRDASLRILQSRRAAGQSIHPFYWAAFVAAGDWK